MFDVVTFGSATVDIFADTFNRNKLTKSQKKMRYEHLISYPVGEKILINDLNISIGGGGTNTAATFNKFGLKTGYVGCLGEDYYGLIIQEFLEQEEIKFLGHTHKKRTGTSIVLDSVEHDRTILTFKGSNDFLDFKKIQKIAFGAKLFYFSSLLNEAFRTQKKILTIAQKKKIKVAFNPSCYQAKKGKELHPVLKNINYLILNKEEAQYLLEDNSPLEKELLTKLYTLLNSNERIAVITDGANGAFCYDGKEYLKSKPFKAKIVETTGAGDAFASAFISGLLNHAPIEKSLQLGMANAHSVISNKGAKEIILDHQTALKFIKKYKYQVTRI